MRFSKYDQRRWGLFVLAVLVMVPVALFVGYAARTDLLGENVWLTFGVFLVLGGAFWSLNLLWWRSLDDVHQQGHLGSWYHGGFFGAFAFVLWVIANQMHKSDYGQGAIHMFWTQVAAALLAYLWWKWRGSRSAGGAGE